MKDRSFEVSMEVAKDGAAEGCTWVNPPDYTNLLISERDYWKKRCLAAEDFIDKSPCDPDITSKQVNAYEIWQNSK